MNKYWTPLLVGTFCLLIVALVSNSSPLFSDVKAASSNLRDTLPLSQIEGDTTEHTSISLFQFSPLNPRNTLYTIDEKQILLTLGKASRSDITGAKNAFEAPLTLPDNAVLTFGASWIRG